MRSLCLLLALAGCVDQASTEPTAPNMLRSDDKSDGGAPLWAGLTSITFERYTQDPCDYPNPHAFGDAPAHYDEWVRERAAFRNICFEVWSPGITDWDNPDFWKQLDVQVHWRFGHEGAFQQAYVNSIDRRGNNRRYAWTIDWSLDPFAYVSTLPSMKVPFDIVSENASYATLAADLEVYFTVNGRTLNAPSDKPFTVRYEGSARKPTLAPNENGYVLYDIVTCDGARFGSGAGYFTADIRDPQAMAALGAGLDGSMIYGVPAARASTNVSLTYLQQDAIAPGQTLPGFSDYGGLSITASGSSMKVDLPVYDRALGKVRSLTATFSNCH